MTCDLTLLDTAAKAEEGAVLDVRHPSTRETLDIKITLNGADSDTYRKASTELMRRAVRRHEKGGVLGKDDAVDDVVTILVACTVGWTGLAEDGKDIPFSRKDAKRLYVKYPWLREQVSTFIENRGNFIPELKGD